MPEGIALKTKDFTIPDGQSVSQWVTFQELFGSDPEADLYVIARVICPATLPSITSIGIETEYGGATKTVRDELGVPVGIAVSANADVALRVANHAMVPAKFRLKSNVNTSGSSRTFVLAFRKV